MSPPTVPQEVRILPPNRFSNNFTILLCILWTSASVKVLSRGCSFTRIPTLLFPSPIFSPVKTSNTDDSSTSGETARTIARTSPTGTPIGNTHATSRNTGGNFGSTRYCPGGEDEAGASRSRLPPPPPPPPRPRVAPPASPPPQGGGLGGGPAGPGEAQRCSRSGSTI